MKKKAAKPLSFSVSQPCSLSTWRRVVADLALVADGSEVQAVRVEGAKKKKKKKRGRKSMKFVPPNIGQKDPTKQACLSK